MLLRKVHNALFARGARIEYAGVTPDPSDSTTFAPDDEMACFASGYVVQNRTNQRRTITLRVAGRQCQYDMDHEASCWSKTAA